MVKDRRVKTWLLVDVSSLAYRSFYAMGDLSWRGEPTEAIFGTLRAVLDLMDLFATKKVAWCFDGGASARRSLYPEYKESRRRRDMAEVEALDRLAVQLNGMRERYLPEVGFRNLMWQKGYEADDQIASVVEWSLDYGKEDCVVVSGDSDLYQLLRMGVIQWIPGRRGRNVYTAEEFRKEWGVEPKDWAMVKAIAGCASDGVDGVDGVGEKTAVKYLRGELGAGSVLYNRIKVGWSIVERNLRLVKLPFDGVNRWELVDDVIDGARWNKLAGMLGARSLMGRV